MNIIKTEALDEVVAIKCSEKIKKRRRKRHVAFGAGYGKLLVAVPMCGVQAKIWIEQARTRVYVSVRRVY